MRHMRSRRILAMLLALSMIFGLLTTTAFAGEVDQNTSNVGESAANGTSEVGSGVGQSSGASEDESSKVTNKEDVPTEEETNPEEKKTTSSEEVDTQVGEGMEVPTATTIATDEALINAINNAVDGDTITLAEGQYQISDLIGLSNANKAVTISAETNATVILNAADGIALHGAKITFNGITFQWGTANYKGIQHASELEYNDCIINGKVFLYAGKETFNHCTFNQDSADYCVWTYGAAETTFNDCTFNCKGKAVLVYNEGYIKTVKVEVNNTTFAASETVDKKAAIELDTHLMKGASITVDNASTATGFSTNTTDGAGLWNAKRIDSENNETVEVVVGGEVKYTLTTAPVAMVNGVSYDKLEDAFAALSDKAYTLTLNDESAWDTATPVYWAAGTQSGYEATLAEALTAAYKANVGDITIICRPGADVGTMTHGHVADNLTIYGNKAYISAGECDLEVDTFKFDRSTGKQATDGVTLDKDITITAYELDNLGVWGQRNTNNTVNVNLTDCDTVNGITVQRVYISGTTGVNNITLTGCDFETKATSVYSNADGDINITNCSFTGAQVPVNFNHKTDGEQTLRVSNCEFNACGDAGEWKQFAAPVRFVNSGSGKQSATVDTCTFTDTVGPNGDILIGDGRTGQESNDVNLTITDTEAKIQAQKPGYYKDDGTTDNALKGEKALTAGETLTVSKMEDLIGGSTGTKGTEANPYTLEELGAMTRADYIAAQTELNGTMYVSVGNYKYGTDGVLGNGVRDDTPGQTPDHSKLNAYGENGYLGDQNDGANGLNIVFVNGSITSGVTGYESIDKIGTSLLLAVPAYTNVTFKGITFNNVMSFNYQLYTSPWSQLGELKFDGCTFNGIIIGSIAAQTLTFNGCTFENFKNTTKANNSNPTWIRPAYGNWTEGDNEGQGSDFRSLTTINFTDNKVTSTRPVKFEYISQWNNTTTLTATGNSFDISAQEGDTETKNVGLYIGPHTDKNAVNLVLDNNTKTGDTAALYVIPKDMSKLPVGSTVKDSSGNAIEIPDALEWKTDTKVTLKTEPVPTVKNVAKVGDTEYATLEDAIANAEAGQTVTLIADVIQNTQLSITKSLTLDLAGHKIYNTTDIWSDNANSILSIKNGAAVTITGSGTIDAKENDCYTINVVNGELTIENGTFYGNVSVVQVEQGKLTVNGGSFALRQKWPGKHYLFNCIDDAYKENTANVEIYGGTFDDFDPNVAPEAAVDGKTPSFAAPGVGIEKNADGTFTAKTGMVAQVLDATGNSVKAYDSLADAITAAAAGQTVRLLADAKEDVEITKNITLDLGGKTLTNTNAGHATITIANGATATVKSGSVVGGTSYYNIQNNGTATFEGLTATAGNTGSSMVDNWGTLTIKSGTYTGGLNTVKSEEGSTLNISGGKFVSDYAPKYNVTGTILVYGTTTIDGGEFIQNSTSNAARTIVTGIVEGYDSITRVTGGTFTCKGGAIFHPMGKATYDNFEVSGGTFNKYVPDSYFKTGYVCVKNENGTYGVAEGKIVAEVGNTGYMSFEAAIAAANALTRSGTIYLRENLTVDYPIVIENAKNKAITLNLQGHTLTSTYAMGTSGAYALVNKTSLTIKNGTFAAGQARAISAYAALTLNGVTVTQTLTGGHACVAFSAKDTTYTVKNSTINGAYSVCVFANNATVAISESTLIGTGNTLYHNGSNYGLKLTVTDSTITSSGGCGVYISGSTTTVEQGGMQQAKFTNCTITGAENGVEVKYTNLTLDNCTVATTATEASYPGNNNGSAANGFAVVSTDNTVDKAVTPKPEGTVTITGANGKYTGLVGLGSLASIKTDYPEFKDETVKVSGGTFDHAIPYEYCAAGYIPVKNGENSYGVKKGTYVAEVNGKQYETLQAAIDAAGRNKTVKLLKDTRENVTMGTPYLTLDLNGHTLNGGQEKGKPALTVTARVTVMDSSAEQTGKIMREDTAENSGVSSHYVIDVQGDGWLTFESGNVINHSGTKEGKGASLVRVGDDSVEKYPGLNIKGGNFQQDNFIAIKVDRGNLFLNGGTITSAKSYAIENWLRTTIKGGTVNGTVSTWVYKDGNSVNDLEISGGTINGNVASVTYDKAEGKTAKVTISGGTVTGTLGTYTYNKGLVSLQDSAKATIGVTGGTFDIDPTPYVVEGSTVKKNSEGKYGVEKAYLAKVGETSYYTMEEAFKAQTTSGEAIVLLRDYTTGSSFSSGSINRTVELNGHTWTYTGTDTNCAAFEINYPNVTLTVKNGTVVSNSMIGLIPSAMGGTITYDNSGLVFESVEATANGNSGIETNGNNTNDTVTLKNSTLNVPNGFGIYFPSSGTLTIENSQITAMTLGVQVCSGSLDIKGQNAAITVNGDPVPKTENDGAIQDGAAISIVNRTGYKGLGTITVTEGTFKAKKGNDAVKAYNWENKTESNFTEPGKVEISGGTYSSEVDAALCKNGFECIGGGTTWTVQTAVEGDAELFGADGTSKGYGYADKLALTATEGQTIKLIKDTTNGGFMLPAGVTLDLNGKTMTSSFLFATGNVIDSTDGTGKLVVAKNFVQFQMNDQYLPLYDKIEGAYRFFSYAFSMPKDPAYGDNILTLRMKLVFTNLKAYHIIMEDSAGEHGINMGFTVSWPVTGGDNQTWGIRLTADKMAQIYKDVIDKDHRPESDLAKRTFDLRIYGLNLLGTSSVDSLADLISAAWPSGITCTTQTYTTQIPN